MIDHGDFVEPELTRLPLSGGRWVDVKRVLNAGEHHKMFSRMVRRMVAGEPIELDPEKVGVAKVEEYVVGWSLVDREGRPVPLSLAAIRNLRQDRFQEIVSALDAHEEQIEREIAEEKKDPDTANIS